MFESNVSVFWLLTGMLGAIFLLLLVRPMLRLFAGQASPRHMYIYRGLCPGCGYDMTGVAARSCPECGRPLTPKECRILDNIAPALPRAREEQHRRRSQ